VRFVSHPKYNVIKYDYDAGVLKVEIPFGVSAVQKLIALVKAGEEAAAGEQAVVSGWGYNKVSSYYS